MLPLLSGGSRAQATGPTIGWADELPGECNLAIPEAGPRGVRATRRPGHAAFEVLVASARRGTWFSLSD